MVENKEQTKKVKNLKIAKAVLGAVAGAATLVKMPILTGVAIAAGLGSALLGATIECDEASMSPSIVR